MNPNIFKAHYITTDPDFKVSVFFLNQMFHKRCKTEP